MKRLMLAVFLVTGAVWGQEWQEFQLTNYQSVQFRMMDSMLDSVGNVHVYFSAGINQQGDNAIMYMRVTPYGEILTDTTRLDSRDGIPSWPVYMAVAGDGRGRSWAIWNDYWREDTQRRAFYMAGRDISGDELLPTTFLSQEGVFDPGAYTGMAAFRSTDETIHVVMEGFPMGYCKLNTEVDTLLWNYPIPDPLNRLGVYPHMEIGPDGTPWAAIRYDAGHPADIALVRFDQDTLLTISYPFGYQTGERWDLFPQRHVRHMPRERLRTARIH